MSDITTRLPVLFLDDLVVLPGMVVPIELDEPAQAALDAARSSSDGRLLVAPRLEDRYASYGVIASIERVGRLSGGAPAAVLRADQRARALVSWPTSTRRSSSPSSSGERPGRSSTRSTR